MLNTAFLLKNAQHLVEETRHTWVGGKIHFRHKYTMMELPGIEVLEELRIIHSNEKPDCPGCLDPHDPNAGRKYSLETQMRQERIRAYYEFLLMSLNERDEIIERLEAKLKRRESIRKGGFMALFKRSKK